MAARLVVTASINWREWERLVQELPQLLDEPPRLEIRCGEFTVESLDDLVSLLKARCPEGKSEGQS